MDAFFSLLAAIVVAGSIVYLAQVIQRVSASISDDINVVRQEVQAASARGKLQLDSLRTSAKSTAYIVGGAGTAMMVTGLAAMMSRSNTRANELLQHVSDAAHSSIACTKRFGDKILSQASATNATHQTTEYLDKIAIIMKMAIKIGIRQMLRAISTHQRTSAEPPPAPHPSPACSPVATESMSPVPSLSMRQALSRTQSQEPAHKLDPVEPSLKEEIVSSNGVVNTFKQVAPLLGRLVVMGLSNNKSTQQEQPQVASLSSMILPLMQQFASDTGKSRDNALSSMIVPAVKAFASQNSTIASLVSTALGSESTGTANGVPTTSAENARNKLADTNASEQVTPSALASAQAPAAVEVVNDQTAAKMHVLIEDEEECKLPTIR